MDTSSTQQITNYILQQHSHAAPIQVLNAPQNTINAILADMRTQNVNLTQVARFVQHNYNLLAKIAVSRNQTIQQIIMQCMDQDDTPMPDLGGDELVLYCIRELA